MITMLGILGITSLILTAVFAFGVLDTPYMEAFRIGFYSCSWCLFWLL